MKQSSTIGGIFSFTTRCTIVMATIAGTAAVAMLGACSGGDSGTGAATGSAVASAERAAEMRRVDDALATELKRQGFTGKIESTLEQRLKRKVDSKLADLGGLLFFDTTLALYGDNACAGCHSPAAGFGDTQSIAIGVQNNGVVGSNRTGSRNQRRSPLVINTPFYPSLMWNGRFSAPSGDPFDNSKGFTFPPPEGTTRFQPNDPKVTHLLMAQAHIPSTELVEMAGFTGTSGPPCPLDSRFHVFDDNEGTPVPCPDVSGFRNEPIRQAVLTRLNETPEYRELFGEQFHEVRAGAPIDFSMVGRAIAEFEFTLVRANAPIDRYARGERNAMTESQKRGGLVFFGKGNCVACHAVAGQSNEMFSDFQMHTIGVPQIAPAFGIGRGNVIFDGLGEDEDFGLAQVTGKESDRYQFRSSPLRNVALQPAFFHNGAFTRLEDAIQHHLDVAASARQYDPRRAGVDRDLQNHLGPIEPILVTLDPLLRESIDLSEHEFKDLVAFVRDGLLDPEARAAEMCRVIPKTVPSGRELLTFQGCKHKNGLPED